MRFFLALLISLGAATAAHADDWRFFSVTGSTRAYVDLQQISTLPSGERQVAIRRFDMSGQADVYEFADLWVVDCRGRRGAPSRTSGYAQDGRLVGTQDIPPGRWIAGEPGTNVGRLVDVVCQGERSVLGPTRATTIQALRTFERSGRAPS